MKGRPSASILLISTVGGRQSRVAKRLDEIQRQDSLFELARARQLQAIRSESVHSLRTAPAEVSPQHVAATLSQILEEGRKLSCIHAVLDSLRYESMEARRHAVPERYARTYEWIYESPALDFSDWLHSRSGIFWVSGRAGSGKSTLMKLLCYHPRSKDALRIWAGTDKLITASHFFWNAGNDMQKSQKGLL